VETNQDSKGLEKIMRMMESMDKDMDSEQEEEEVVEFQWQK
jgi:hypothetical protein